MANTQAPRFNEAFWDKAEQHNSFGMKLMMKMGWNKGEGIGKEKEGISGCITVTQDNSKRGIGLFGSKKRYKNQRKSKFKKSAKWRCNACKVIAKTKPQWLVHIATEEHIRLTWECDICCKVAGHNNWVRPWEEHANGKRHLRNKKLMESGQVEQGTIEVADIDVLIEEKRLELLRWLKDIESKPKEYSKELTILPHSIDVVERQPDAATKEMEESMQGEDVIAQRQSVPSINESIKLRKWNDNSKDIEDSKESIASMVSTVESDRKRRQLFEDQEPPRKKCKSSEEMSLSEDNDAIETLRGLVLRNLDESSDDTIHSTNTVCKDSEVGFDVDVGESLLENANEVTTQEAMRIDVPVIKLSEGVQQAQTIINALQELCDIHRVHCHFTIGSE